MRAQQNCRHQYDCRYSVGNSQVAPLDPVASAETVGNRKGRTPEGGPERNEHDCDEDEDHRVTKRERLEGRFNKDANPGRCGNILDRVESLAV